MRYSPLSEGDHYRTRYIHVQQQSSQDGDPLEMFEVTWSDDPDTNPAGSFEWWGNRLAWVTKLEGGTKVLDGFLCRHAGPKPRHKIFINANGYGIVLLSCPIRKGQNII